MSDLWWFDVLGMVSLVFSGVALYSTEKTMTKKLLCLGVFGLIALLYLLFLLIGYEEMLRALRVIGGMWIFLAPAVAWAWYQLAKTQRRQKQ